MPQAEKEWRKRGRKKKNVSNTAQGDAIHENITQVPASLPDWILAQPNADNPSTSPFGEVDSEFKAYFRSVGISIDGWTDESMELDGVVVTEELNDRKMFIEAVVTEICGKELPLATDPECSRILERVIEHPLSDDRSRKAMLIATSDSFWDLSQHVFGSRVCQTLMRCSMGALRSECQGLQLSLPDSYRLYSSASIETVFGALAEKSLPLSSLLLSHSYSSHVFRDLLALLSSDTLADVETSGLDRHGNPVDRGRGTKSVEARPSTSGSDVQALPPSFGHWALQILHQVRLSVPPELVHSLATDKNASHVLQCLIRIELQNELEDERDALVRGIFSSVDEQGRSTIRGIICDSIGSHLVQNTLKHATPRFLTKFWMENLSKDLPELLLHPFANFVVSAAVNNVNVDCLHDVLTVPKQIWRKSVSSARTGPLKALMDRAKKYPSLQSSVIEIVRSAFNLNSPDDTRHAVLCILSLSSPSTLEIAEQSSVSNPDHQSRGVPSRGKRSDAMLPNAEPTIQGASILRSIFNLPSPHHTLASESLRSMDVQKLLALCHHRIGSHVIDDFVTSSAIPFRSKAALITTLVGHFHEVADDRLGGHVAINLWNTADPYLRKRIAESVADQEDMMRGSPFARHLVKRANLWQLRNQPNDWVAAQAQDYRARHAPG